MTKRYKQAREDYEYLVAHHESDVYDLTGGFVLDNHCFELLKNPTKTQASELYELLIEHSSYAGFGLDERIEPDLSDERVVEIYTRHCCI